MRHGDAGPNAASHSDDNARELNERGIVEVERVIAAVKAMGLKMPSVILTSPLPRAKKTAEIAKRDWATGANIEVTDSLIRGELLPVMSEIANQYPSHHSVLVAGHEPLLSSFASALLSGNEKSFIELDKGGFIHLSVYQLDPVRMRAFLKMCLAPQHLAEKP